jgi:RNA polymerase sigma-70 factor (ECF subfamily)
MIVPLPGDGTGISESSDQSLLQDFRAGDLEAATALYERYARRLFALARGQLPPNLSRQVDPDDIVQSVFRSFFEAAKAGAFAVPDGSDLWPLLLVVALNKIRAQGAFHTAAKRDVRRTQGLGESESLAGALAALQSGGSQPFLRVVALDLIEALPPQVRAVVELRLEGYSVNQIATRVERTKRSVERLLQESRRRLDQMLTEESPVV